MNHEKQLIGGKSDREKTREKALAEMFKYLHQVVGAAGLITGSLQVYLYIALVKFDIASLSSSTRHAHHEPDFQPNKIALPKKIALLATERLQGLKKSTHFNICHNSNS